MVSLCKIVAMRVPNPAHSHAIQSFFPPNFCNRKKATCKGKKKMKQEANLRTTKAYKIKCQSIKKDASLGTSGQPAESSGSGVTLVQNKENRLAGRLGWRGQTSLSTTASQNQNGGEGASRSGETLYNPYRQYEAPAAHYEQDNKVEITSYTPAPNRSNRGKAGAEAKPSSDEPLDEGTQKTKKKCPSSRRTRQSEDMDFTSDDIYKLGATLYEQEPVTTTTSPQPSPGQSAASIRDADVSVMLRHIRRALGMPSAYNEDSGREESELHSLLETQSRTTIKQEMSLEGARKRRHAKKGKGMPR